MQLIEKNQDLNKDNETLRTQNLTLRDRISEIEADGNQTKVRRAVSIEIELLLLVVDRFSAAGRTASTQ